MAAQPSFSFDALARFADNLYRARQRAELSQTKAAEEASIGRPWLDRIEAGESAPPLDVLIKLAFVYSTSTGRLLEGISWTSSSVGGPLQGEYVVSDEPAVPADEGRSAGH